MHKSRSTKAPLVECDVHIKRVSYSQYLDEKQPRKGKVTRFCADNLTLLKKHLSSMKKVHGAACSMCGKLTYMECQLCQKHVCFKSGKGTTTDSVDDDDDDDDDDHDDDHGDDHDDDDDDDGGGGNNDGDSGRRRR